MTAQAMIMRMYLGHDRDSASLAQGADYLLAHLPEVGTQETSQRDCYYWYYATQAMYHMQGDYWKTWDARVTPLLRAGQIDRGPLKGSWSPRARARSLEPWRAALRDQHACFDLGVPLLAPAAVPRTAEGMTVDRHDHAFRQPEDLRLALVSRKR